MNILSHFIIVILFVSVVCAKGTNAAENSGKAVLAQPRPTVSLTAEETSIEVCFGRQEARRTVENRTDGGGIK